MYGPEGEGLSGGTPNTQADIPTIVITSQRHLVDAQTRVRSYLHVCSVHAPNTSPPPGW